MSNWTPEELAAQRRIEYSEPEGDALCGGIPDQTVCTCGHIYYRHAGSDMVCQSPACPCKSFQRSGDGEPRGANTRQVGGEHYGLTKVQHWDLVVQFGWDYFQGQIIKYVMRCKKKNGLQDLEKAAHYLEKYIEEIKAGRIKLE